MTTFKVFSKSSTNTGGPLPFFAIHVYTYRHTPYMHTYPYTHIYIYKGLPLKFLISRLRTPEGHYHSSLSPGRTPQAHWDSGQGTEYYI
jgi:hypothetical protein